MGLFKKKDPTTMSHGPVEVNLVTLNDAMPGVPTNTTMKVTMLVSELRFNPANAKTTIHLPIDQITGWRAVLPSDSQAMSELDIQIGIPKQVGALRVLDFVTSQGEPLQVVFADFGNFRIGEIDKRLIALIPSEEAQEPPSDITL